MQQAEPRLNGSAGALEGRDEVEEVISLKILLVALRQRVDDLEAAVLLVVAVLRQPQLRAFGSRSGGG